MTPLERLIARLMRARAWPLPAEAAVRRRLSMWAALLDNDEPYLRKLMKFESDRPLIVDNMPEVIARAYGGLLFGQPPTWTPEAEADADAMAAMTSSWTGELAAAEETCAAEGEVWWRLSNDGVSLHPTLTWHSRTDVVPLLHGRNVLACAFVSRLTSASRSGEVWRHVEVHGAGEMRNLLFRGRESALGTHLDLARHVETAELADVWRHDLPMLAGRVVHAWGRKPHVGRSIYAGVWTKFLALNRAQTIGEENVILTAKKRAIVPASAVRPRAGIAAGEDRGDGSFERIASRPVFDAGEDVIVSDPLDVEEGGSAGNPFRILEYSFDAASLIAWIDHRVEDIALRCGLVPQFIGTGDVGQGASGVWLRLMLMPTTNAADSSGGRWDEVAPAIAHAGALFEQLGQAWGGFGRTDWTAAGGRPTFERADPIPVDVAERDLRHAQLKTAELISVEMSLRERYPGHDDEWYDEEIAKIRADTASTVGAIGSGIGGNSAPPEA